jgi:hypothetical protein
LLQQGFVALASDVDDPEDELMTAALHLEGAQMLPFVLFLDAEGRFLAGSSGAVNPLSLEQTLGRLRSGS